MENFDLKTNQEIDDGYRISPQQEYIWSLQRKHQNIPYQVSCSVSIVGELDLDIFQKAFSKVIERHENFRTIFSLLPGMEYPLQQIVDHSCVDNRFEDLSQFTDSEQKEKLQSISIIFDKEIFDFQKLSLLKSVLIKVSQDQYILLVKLPVLCGDSVTLNNFIRELSETYQACVQNEELPAAEIQYADIAEWLQEILEDEETEIGKKYWQEIDINDLNNFRLLNEKLEQKRNFKAETYPISVSKTLLSKIENITNQCDLSISEFLLSTFYILLFKLTNKSNIIIGSLSDGRSDEDLAQAMGLLAKYLPMTIHLEDKNTFIEIVEQISARNIEFKKYQDFFTWNNLEGESKDISDAFFPYCFDWEESFPNYSTQNISFSVTKKYSYISPFKLKLIAYSNNGTLNLNFNYDERFFENYDIKQLEEQFITLLSNIIENPTACLDKLSILSSSEKQKVLVDFNNTGKRYSQETLTHIQVENQAKQTPDNPAIIFEEQKLTYDELNRKSNQIAHYLIDKGVTKESIVALYIDRSIDLIIAILAIHKIGATYLPLDPTLPQEGLDFRLKDVDVTALITQDNLFKNIQNFSRTLINLDIEKDKISEAKEENVNIEVSANNLAYIIYTSGSTGKPKAVAVEHKQLMNYVYSIIERLKLPEVCHFAHVSSLAADLGNTAIFPTLFMGGCLHLISENRVTDVNKLAEYCRRYPIDCLKIVPSHLSTLIAAANSPEEILPNQRLILGGETLNWTLVEQITEYKPECQIFNHYGPTETTIGVLTYPVNLEKRPQTAQTVPIGSPINNTQIYLLDRYLNPVSINVPGEIYIGGENLTRGYLNRSKLTDEKFITNPFNPEQKLYKTGDLARYLGDGNIEFLGRVDNQVKLRGFRLELGEIEANLNKHQDIRDAIVLLRDNSQNNKYLVAYVTTHQDLVSNSHQLKAEIINYLKTQLPDYMIPRVFIFLKTLPLTTNGKIDRSQLPDPELCSISENYVAPSNAIEETLIRIWSDILGQEEIGINHNFFELGGDSILSIQIIARANQAGIKITPKQLFEHQTVAKLATVAEINSRPSSEEGLTEGSAIITPIQKWFFEQNNPETFHWNQAVLLEVEENINIEYLEQSFKHLLLHHDGLRLIFKTEDNVWTQTYSPPSEFTPFEVVDLSNISSSEQTEKLQEKINECQRSLNLSEGPIMRATLLHLGNNQPSRLLIVIHHLVVDGVSWRILLQDFGIVYQQLKQGQKIELPLKTTSFQKWGENLKIYAQSEELKSELDYWLGQVPINNQSIPIDYSVGLDENKVASTDHLIVSLGEEKTRLLIEDIPQVYNTQINDILLTALVQTFANWLDEYSLLIDLEGHGREDLFEDVDISRTIGWFTSIFPVLLTIPKASNQGEMIKSIKEQLRQIPNKGIGYGILRYLTMDEAIRNELKDRTKSQVRFNYLGQVNEYDFQSYLLKVASESTGLSKSPTSVNNYLIDINSIVSSNRLQVTWSYSKKLYQTSTIKKLAQGYINALEKLIEHCQSSDAGGYTPSDFSATGLSQDELDDLLLEID
ncbi:amino acid adenylation domain-containing protein [Crocosphaera sp. Alani8]|uniref:amino acid adenylation domain-containing protein n=1 Tax=Crocosphaera sp. Alani8 TaxID=3038952 RepID=UPI00313BCAFC